MGPTAFFERSVIGHLRGLFNGWAIAGAFSARHKNATSAAGRDVLAISLPRRPVIDRQVTFFDERLGRRSDLELDFGAHRSQDSHVLSQDQGLVLGQAATVPGDLGPLTDGDDLIFVIAETGNTRCSASSSVAAGSEGRLQCSLGRGPHFGARGTG